MDPLTIAAVVAGVTAAGRAAVAYAETRRLRARADLVRAVADLAPGTEITGSGRGGAWSVRTPGAPAVSAPAGKRTDEVERG
ncbi:hypothetical protein AB0M20_44790 [Actinoplanes sp. NPDC051633]|uniref:hypothetical protein n=1 Tax=Actinoplanes sp. NPDC051633 TaxID=3155670 RepID=UPI00341BE3B2